MHVSSITDSWNPSPFELIFPCRSEKGQTLLKEEFETTTNIIKSWLKRGMKFKLDAVGET